MNLRFLPLIGTAVLLSGCIVYTSTGPIQYDSQTVEADRSELVHVTLRMGAGELRAGSGTSKLMQAYFTYNVPSWKPMVHYSAGNLRVEQPSNHGHVGHLKYEWDLRFNRETPIDMTVHLGAGEAQLDLGALDLRNVSVHMGVGKVDLDLRGTPKHDYGVHVQGGVGEAIVRLPSNAGVYATAAGGIGEIRMRNLRKDGDHWVNDLLGRAKVQVRVDVHGGIGAITLIGQDE